MWFFACLFCFNNKNTTFQSSNVVINVSLLLIAITDTLIHILQEIREKKSKSYHRHDEQVLNFMDLEGNDFKLPKNSGL